MEPPWEGRKKVYINGPGYMTKMAAMEKASTNLFLQNRKSKVNINDDPEVTLTYFKTMSNLAKLVFVLTVAPDIR